MADAMLFEVDASKIVAKLHLAGVQSLEYKAGEFIVNTGVKDDDAKATPQNPGKTSFEIAHKSYQVGYVLPIVYSKPYGIEDAFNKLKAAFDKAKGPDSKIDSSIDSKEQDEYNAAKEEFKKHVTKPFKDEVDKLLDGENDVPGDDIPGIEAKIDEIKKASEDSYNQALATAKKYAYEQVKKYLDVFAGKDNMNAFSEDSMGEVFVADDVKDSNDKRLVDNYMIQPADDSEKKKMVAQFRAKFEKDPNKDNCKHKMCFYVGYTLDVEK